MNFLSNIFVVLWLILGLVVAALAMYRRMIASHEDDVVHVTSGENRLIAQQVSMAQKIEKIDFWGKSLTIVLVAYGLGIGAWILYELWVQSSRLPTN